MPFQHASGVRIFVLLLYELAAHFTPDSLLSSFSLFFSPSLRVLLFFLSPNQFPVSIVESLASSTLIASFTVHCIPLLLKLSHYVYTTSNIVNMRFTPLSALLGLLAVQQAAAVSFLLPPCMKGLHLSSSTTGWKRLIRLAMLSRFPYLLKIHQPVHQRAKGWHQLRRKFAAHNWLLYGRTGHGCPECKLRHHEMQIQQEKPFSTWGQRFNGLGRKRMLDIVVITNTKN